MEHAEITPEIVEAVNKWAKNHPYSRQTLFSVLGKDGKNYSFTPRKLAQEVANSTRIGQDYIDGFEALSKDTGTPILELLG
jgi:hypothetical protein